MLYTHSAEPRLSPDVFQNPPAAYRGAPFWAWNCELEPAVLESQIETFREMGLGGFHIHTRVGMATEYLGDEYMALVERCRRKAEELGLLCWLYDEDKWPSGFAGGYVTRDPRFRARHLLLSPQRVEELEVGRAEFEARIASGGIPAGYRLAAYAVRLEDGYLAGHRLLEENEAPSPGEQPWYAYLQLAAPSNWYNGETYVDTLNPEAIRRFIEVTHKRYTSVLGEHFGKSIPAIFTDEPQHPAKQALKTPASREALCLPWTDDFEASYQESYGESLLAALPQLVWQLPQNAPSTARYRYHDFVCERFVSAFCDQVGEYCKKQGILLTGHIKDEDSLGLQTRASGEMMRCYRGFGLPGVDVLVDNRELTAVKQVQSAARQLGQPGVASELYGVTGFDFSFRRQKLAGDWQAALGVTTRVQHLALASMKGEAKRDHPVYFGEQMPWHGEYRLLEDHFARVGTALTRGRAAVHIAVVHPVESYWLAWGPMLQTQTEREELERRFQDVARWLLYSHLDFDYISESLLPQQCGESPGAPLPVGEMTYDAVVVPGCVTLRKTTLVRLQSFLARGGQVYVLGEWPSLVDAKPGQDVQARLAGARLLPFTQSALLAALEPLREVELRDEADGATAPNLVHQLRQDGDSRWLFLAHVEEEPDYDFTRQLYGAPPDRSRRVAVTLRGEWDVELYNTLDGSITRLCAAAGSGQTALSLTLYPYDSCLLHLLPAGASKKALPAPAAPANPWRRERLADPVPFTLSEPNVLLLDLAEYSFDGENWQPREEILKIDSLAAQQLGIKDKSDLPQPWVYSGQSFAASTVWLRFTVYSEVDTTASLALENAATTALWLNGVPLAGDEEGWYIDRAFTRVPGLTLQKGENQLVLACRYDRVTYLERAYLLGSFGVAVRGSHARLTPLPASLAFGSITHQGLPFYGGNVTYRFSVNSQGEEMALEAPRFAGMVLAVSLDGKKKGHIAWDPYTLSLGNVPAGEHTLEITLFGSRNNTLGALHNDFASIDWYGPLAWRSEGYGWCEEYKLSPAGILTAPNLLRRD